MAPKVRTAAEVAARPTVPVRSVVVHHRRALPRNAAQVGRRTIAVAVHRPRTAALGIATVATVLLAVLFYLSQMFQVAAAHYELDGLAKERVLLLQELRTQDGQVAGLAAEGVVRTWAQEADLDWKDQRQRFEAR